MSTPIIRLPQSARRSRPPRDARRPDLPAIYIGTMPGVQNLPAIDLYNLLVPVGAHPVGSTVSRTTLEKHGFHVPLLAASERRGDGNMSGVESRSLQVASAFQRSFSNRDGSRLRREIPLGRCEQPTGISEEKFVDSSLMTLFGPTD